jgi:UDP-N-acetylglucosamine transferase subunit ALG13
MIFVTVGNSIKGVEFHRLIREIDEIGKDLNEEVVAQIGFIEDPPKHITSFSYLNYVEILEYFRKASIIIGHCGVGTVLNGLIYRKPTILVPRSKSQGEHIDDHQRELAEKLKGREGFFVVEDIGDLRKMILDVRELIEKGHQEPRFSAERDRLLSFVKSYVKDYQACLRK